MSSHSDSSGKKSKKGPEYLICPLCECELPSEGTEKPGEEVFCPSCESPLIVKVNKETGEIFLK